MKKPQISIAIILTTLVNFIFPCINNISPANAAMQQIVANQNQDLQNIENLATKFMEMLGKEDFNAAAQYFEKSIQPGLSPQQLEQVWRSITSQLGTYQKQIAIRSQKSKEFDIAFVTSEFTKGKAEFRIVFNSNKNIVGFFLSTNKSVTKIPLPAYFKVDKFTEKEVTIGSGEWALPGTLTLPVGNSKSIPAVVLVHGSGPQDRDETLGPNKPFRDIAWGLAAQGIAVLRYEKRSKQHSAKFAAQAVNLTVKEETIDDALLAVSLLRKTPQINPKKIFVLGHSLGGMLIPKIGKADANIAGLIVLAGNTRKFEDLTLDQIAYLLSLNSTVSPEEKEFQTQIQRQVAKIKSPQLAKLPEQEIMLGAHPKYWLDLRNYQPAEVAKKLKQPMLILQGERDYQVTMVDFAGWQKALATKGNVTFKTYPLLNHLFMAGEGKSRPEEYEKPGYVLEEVINDIGNWINSQKK